LRRIFEPRTGADEHDFPQEFSTSRPVRE